MTDVTTSMGFGSRDVVTLSSSVLPKGTMVKIRLSVDLGLTGLIAGALPDLRVPSPLGMAKAEAQVSFVACPILDDGGFDVDDPFVTAEAHRSLEYDYSGSSHSSSGEDVPTGFSDFEVPIGTSFGLVETFSTTAEVAQSFYFVGGGPYGYTYVDGTGYAEADLYGCRVGIDVLTSNANADFASGYRYAQAVPEPAAFLPLGLGALALVRRRNSPKAPTHRLLSPWRIS